MYVFRPCLVDNNPVQELCDVLRDADIGAQELRVRYIETTCIGETFLMSVLLNLSHWLKCVIQAEYILMNDDIVSCVLHISLLVYIDALIFNFLQLSSSYSNMCIGCTVDLDLSHSKW